MVLGAKMTTELGLIGLVVFATIIGSFGSLYLKKASKNFNFSFNGIFNFELIFGIFIYFLATLIFIAALRKGELNVLYPVTSLSYVWVSLLSVKFLKEKINRFKVGGIFLIILGVIAITV